MSRRYEDCIVEDDKDFVHLLELGTWRKSAIRLLEATSIKLWGNDEYAVFFLFLVAHYSIDFFLLLLSLEHIHDVTACMFLCINDLFQYT